jgi:predicted helicase
MTALTDLLFRFRETAVTHREAGTYFEDLTLRYLRTEPVYRDLYREVWTYGEWAERRALDRRDAGIDLVAETFTGEVHAVQCKLYSADYRLQKSDIDSFFTASGKSTFARRVIVSTTNDWSPHAEDALRDQQPPVTKIDLAALEGSVIDWTRFDSREAPALRPKKALRPHQRDALAAVRRGFASSERG